jgi:hypothetical protein
MKQIILMLLLGGALCGCAKQSDLDAANAKLVTANASLEAANQTISDQKAQIAALQTQADQLNARLSIKPRLPVTFTARHQLLGQGLVVEVNTTIKQPLQVLATIKNPTLGTTKEVELELNGVRPTFISSAQGTPIDSGDQITLTNNNYTPAEFMVR